MNVDKVVYVDNEPEITKITDLSTNQSDEKLTMGKPAAIFGSRLKLSDSGSGIYFAKVETTGTISNDEQNWILVPKENIFRNKPSELNFFVPDS